jgi:competence protein ComEA
VAGQAGAGQPANGGAKINLNKATVEELATLPRVGPVLAKRIFDWRAQHGKFRSPNDLDAIEGIGPKLLEALLPLVAV